MSGASNIELVSHVYGSTPRGFATVFADPSIEPDVLREIERRCTYSLPFSLARAEPGDAPLKYLFGTHGSRGFAGRARYLGVDLTGRLGNYVCHTFVFDIEKAARLLESPLDMLVRCDAAELFFDRTPAEGEAAAPVTLELTGAYVHRQPRLDGDLLLDLVSAALRGPSGEPPVLFRGGEDEVIDILEDVFSYLPYSKRWRCTFDTYGLAGYPQGLVFTALPPDRAYAPVPPHVASVDIDAGTISWVRGQAAHHPLARLVCTGATGADDRAALLSAIDLVEERQWAELADTLNLTSATARAALYAEYRAPLLGRISEASDTALADALDEQIAPDDLLVLPQPARLSLVLACGPRARGALARLVVARASEAGMTEIAFADESFLRACIDVSRATKQAGPFVVALLRALGGAYAPWREERVVAAAIEELRLPAQPAFKAALRDALAGLPTAPSREIDRDRVLALFAAGASASLARYAALAGAEPGHWDDRPEMLRYVGESLVGLPYDEAAAVLAEVLGRIAPGSMALGMFDRVIAGRLDAPRGIATDRHERKAFAKALAKRGVPLERIPATQRVLQGESGGAPRAADDRKRGRDR